MPPTLKIKRVDKNVKMPVRKTSASSGVDVYGWKFLMHYKKHTVVHTWSDRLGFQIQKEDISNNDESIIDIEPGERVLIDTGIIATVGPGHEIQVRPRSGISLEKGLLLINTPATIDEDYRGTIKIMFANYTIEKVSINLDVRLAQLVVCPVVISDIVEVDSFDATSRGNSGIGSTGIK